jgi:hypothetical protein
MVTHGKRIAYGRNQNRVAIATYPDDTSVPVRTSHWNQNPHDQAVLGFTKITATLASDVLQTKDNSSTTLEDDGNTYSRQSTLIEVVPQSGSATDVIAKINIIDTLENDVLYLFKATASDTITIASATPSQAGHIKTQLSGGATLVHDGVPIMLIRRGDYWYEFGADGAASSFTPTSTDTLQGKTINTSANTITVAAADVSDFDTEVGNNSAVTANTAKVTYPTADSNKLAGIEVSATADQTNAEIVAAVEAGSDSNTFTDDDHTKLNSIEASATIDQTDAEIRTAVGAATDSNVFTDANVTTLGTVAAKAPLASPTFTTAVTLPATDLNGNDLDNIQNLIHDITSTASVSGARTLDLNADQLETWALSGSTAITFNTTSNKAEGRSKTIRLVNDGTAQNLTLHSSWKIVGTAPTDIAASKTGILTLTCFGTAETDIVAAYAVEE